MSALVRLVDVSKRYAGTAALHSTNLLIERSKTTVLIGPSGCGKSTLLRLIIRLIEPDSGHIDFDREPINAENIDNLRRRIGYVIQEGGLFPHLTARANVLLMARHVGKSQDEMRTKLLELCQLTRFSESLVRISSWDFPTWRAMSENPRTKCEPNSQKTLSAGTIPGVWFAFRPGIFRHGAPSGGHWRARSGAGTARPPG